MKQLEFTPRELSSLLHLIGTESPTAYFLMRELCAATGADYPPMPLIDGVKQAKRDAMPDPLETII